MELQHTQNTSAQAQVEQWHPGSAIISMILLSVAGSFAFGIALLMAVVVGLGLLYTPYN
jgi:type IV secretory pathway VirB2 component (pilin)